MIEIEFVAQVGYSYGEKDAIRAVISNTQRSAVINRAAFFPWLLGNGEQFAACNDYGLGLFWEVE